MRLLKVQICARKKAMSVYYCIQLENPVENKNGNNAKESIRFD